MRQSRGTRDVKQPDSVDAPSRARKDEPGNPLGERDHTTESLGERLKRLRKERGLSQRELSSPGVSYAYISRIEAGARQPSVKALRKLARKLGVSAEYLETGSEITGAELRQLQLAEAELRLRLDNEDLPLEDLAE